MIKAVLFDFDGTIIDTSKAVMDTWKKTYKELTGSEGGEEIFLDTFGEPVHVSMKRLFPDRDPDECVAIYRSFQPKDYILTAELCPGMKELILKLKEEGYLLGIVTSRTRETAFQGMDKHGITECFDYVVSCDDTDAHKPSPVPAQIALEKLGVAADEAIMVGDSMFDILCAHNAGIKAAAVGWQIVISEEELKGPDGPEYVIDRAMDLMEILND